MTEQEQKVAEQKTTEEELKKAREAAIEADEKLRAHQDLVMRTARASTLDSFQQYQKEQTEKEIEKKLKESPTSSARHSPEYSRAGTVMGTEGDNANFNPQRKYVESSTKWDPHAGAKKPEDEKKYKPAPSATQQTAAK